MLALVAVAVVSAFLASLAGCELVRRIAQRRALLDEVNERSLHTVPTPRLGGVAIVTTSIIGGCLACALPSKTLPALLGASSALALVGLRDDLRPLPASLRLLVQLALASAFVVVVGVPPLLLAPGVVLPIATPIAGAVLVVWTVGLLNVYNFMDGMDGLAASQAVSASSALALLLVGVAAPAVVGALPVFAFVVAGASLGFLAHNAPPARMFMGDAGSTFLGMVFASLAILGLLEGVPLAVSALPLAPFLLDGTFTIARRASKRERIWTAHRSHLYQRAVQTGLSHREVLLVYLAWLAVGAGSAWLAARGAAETAGAWALAIAGLVVVWRWVVRRESDRAGVA